MLAFGSEIANASESELSDVISKRMDISEIMAFAVVDRAIKNDDGPFHWYCGGVNCSNHNYYWYEDPVAQTFHLIPWDMDVSFQNIKGDKNPITQIADAWGKVRADCDPFNHGPFNIPQRSAACDKLSRAGAILIKNIPNSELNYWQVLCLLSKQMHALTLGQIRSEKPQ